MPVSKPAKSNGRVIAHVDMDCFYVQVEQRRQPHLRGLPTAVVQYNEWKGGGLIAVSYEARKHGVKRSMRGDEAKDVCPEIQLVQVPVARGKADLSIYRNAGSEVVSILARKGRCERASIDEVYLDLTEAAEFMLAETPPENLQDIDEEALKSHILGVAEVGNNVKEIVSDWLKRSADDHHDKLLSCGAIIVAELRKQVLQETEFTCSAGVAHNKMLAKLASGLNKPAQQTIVPSAAVADFLGPWPIKKMKQLGGKLGDSLQNDLGIRTVGEMLQFSQQKLQERYGINTGNWLWNIARGIDGEEVKGRILPMSHGSGKTFRGPHALRSFETVEHWLKQLCEELSERLLVDLDNNKRIANTLTLHVSAFKSSDTDSQKRFPSKSCPLRYGCSKMEEDALRLFHSGLMEFMGEANKSSGWGVTGLSVGASKITSVPQGTCTIRKFFASKHVGSSPEVANNDPSREAILLLESNNISTSSVLSETEHNIGGDQISDIGLHENGGNYPKGQMEAGFLSSFIQEQASSGPSLHQAACDQTPDITNRENVDSMAEGREIAHVKVKGTSSIMRYLTRLENSGPQLKHVNFQGTFSGDTEASSVLHAAHRLGKRERWSYKAHEIDPTIVDELPPDIQKEIRDWMQPLKQHISPKRKSITSYFLPSRSTG